MTAIKQGEFRSIYTAMADDDDIHAMPGDVFKALVMLKLGLPTTGLGVVYLTTLADQVGCSRERLEEILVLLEAPKPGRALGWIVRDRSVVWVVNALACEPGMKAESTNHRKFIQRSVAQISPTSPVVLAFREHYAPWFEPVVRPLQKGSDDGYSEDSRGDFDGSSKGPEGVPDQKKGKAVAIETTHKAEEAEDASAAGIGDDPVSEFVANRDFGPFARSVEGLIRSARQPVAVVQTLRMHLDGEMGHEKATPRQLGLACQDFLAQGDPFNARHFAGFVRGAQRAAELVENRRQNSAEAAHITAERAARARADADVREASELLSDFARSSPDRFEQLKAAAERKVPSKFGPLVRPEMVRHELLFLIRSEPQALTIA